MRIPRIYFEGPIALNTPFTLPQKTSHYLSTVLRMESGRQLILFNGSGAQYPATLQTPHKKNTVVIANDEENLSKESPLKSHLAIGVSRGERFDFVLQKATELGVTEVTPLITERTEVKLNGERLEKKMGHWQQIVISACEQCERNTLPKLNTLARFNEWIAKDQTGLNLVLHHRSDKALGAHTKPENVNLLVGPEGGLSEAEITAAQGAGFAPLTLGPRVLRTETAPIVALSALQVLWGDF